MHRCPIIEVTDNNSADLKVLEVDMESNTSVASILLTCNTPRQIASICETGGFCVKGGFPYLFPKKNQKLPILNKIGVVEAADYKKLKAAVSEGPVTFKKILK